MQIKEIRKRIMMMIPYAKRTILSTRMFVLCINILIIAAIVIVTPSLSFQLQTYDIVSHFSTSNVTDNVDNNNKSTQTNKTQIQVFTVDSKPYGLTYSKWTAKWW